VEWLGEVATTFSVVQKKIRPNSRSREAPHNQTVSARLLQLRSLFGIQSLLKSTGKSLFILKSVFNFEMSSLNIATLPRINRDALAAQLKAGTTPAKLAIIDVRDSGMTILNVQSYYGFYAE